MEKLVFCAVKDEVIQNLEFFLARESVAFSLVAIGKEISNWKKYI